MSQKKKKKKSPSLTHTHTRSLTRSLPFVMFVFGNWIQYRRVFADHLLPLFRWCLCEDLGLFPLGFWFWLLLFCKPHTYFFSANPRDLSEQSEEQSESCWGLPKYHLQAFGGDQRKQAFVLLSSTAYSADNTTVDFNKDLIFLCCMKRGPIPSLRKDANIALFWNTASLVPCSRVCSSDGVLRRPICLADHSLFDVAANVTFLFQSKTQQGLPSVWHRP